MLRLEKINIQNMFIIFMLLVFLSFVSGIYWLFFITLSFSSIAMILKGITFLNTKPKTEKEIRSYKHSVVFMTILYIAIVGVVTKNFSSIILLGQVFLGLLFLVFSVIFLVLTLCIYFRNYSLCFVNIGKWLKSNIILLLISAIFVACSVDGFLCYPIWDTADYYNWLLKIDVSTFNDLSCLKLCYHCSVMYAIVVYVFSCFVGNLYAGVICFNILCGVLALFVMFKFVKKLCPNCGKIFPYLCATVFAFSPFLFGFTGYVYNDLALTYGIVFFLYCFCLRNQDLIFLSTLFLIFSKEIGFVISVCVLIVPLLYRFVVYIKKGRIKEFFKKNINIFYISLAILFLSWIVIFCLSFGKAGGMHWYSLSFAHIATVLKTMLFTNFTWIFALIVLIALTIFIVKLIQRKQRVENFLLNKTNPVIIAFLISLLFNFICVTWEHSRYLMPEIISIYILSFVSLDYICNYFKFSFVKNIILIIILPLFIVQSYFTIDPFMLNSNAKIWLGDKNNYMIPAGYRDSELVNVNYNDNVVYNKQIIGIQCLVDKVLQTIEYDDSKCVVFGNGAIQRGIVAFGNATGVKWDSKFGRRVLTNNREDKINVIKLDNFEQTTEKLDGRFEYYFVDFYAEDNGRVNDYIATDSNFRVSSVKEIYYFGWHITVSKLEIA